MFEDRIDVVSKGELDDAVVAYFVSVQGLSGVDARFVLTDFGDPRDCMWIGNDYVQELDHNGKNYEVYACWTDFFMMRTMKQSPRFCFYTLSPDDGDEMYIINELDPADFPKGYIKKKPKKN